MRYFISLFLILLLQGCITSSKNPISDAKESDKALYGSWSISKGNKVSYLHINPSKKRAEFHLVYEESKRGDIDERMVLLGHVSSLDGKKYLNTRVVESEDKFPDGYMFFQYHIVGDELKIKIMNPEVIESAIKTKELQGFIGKEKFLPNITITQEQKGLQKFITKNAERLFGEEANFTKSR